MKKVVFLLLSVGFLLSCGNKKPSVKPYYFPYAEFFTPKVYKYVNAKDSTEIQYWRFETGAQNGDTVMTTGIYDRNLKLVTVYHNKITEEGSRLQKMLVNTNSIPMMRQCEIKQDESFNWVVKPQVPLFLSFNMKSNDESESTEIVSERKFEPKKEMLSFNGENYECIVVKESTIYNLITPNRTRSEEQQRTSYFAKGVGLVQYETFYANGKNELFRLQEIIIGQEEMFQSEKKDTSSTIQ